MVARRQLLELGFTPAQIRHRVAAGRLHPVTRGVYAVGRRELTPEGWWMTAVLACGPEAALSHLSAASLWTIRPHKQIPLNVTVPTRCKRRRPGIVVHRHNLPDSDHTLRNHIPVTTPIRTLIDLATILTRPQLEAAINEADKLDRIDPDSLRASLEGRYGQRGVGTLRTILDRHTFVLTRSELERLFLPIARRAGLPKPQTQSVVNGFEVDFHWPELGLVVETDGLRYHRTPAQQAKDRLRDQTHTAAGMTHLRFTHGQIRYEPDYVRRTLAAVARRVAA